MEEMTSITCSYSKIALVMTLRCLPWVNSLWCLPDLKCISSKSTSVFSSLPPPTARARLVGHVIVDPRSISRYNNNKGIDTKNSKHLNIKLNSSFFYLQNLIWSNFNAMFRHYVAFKAWKWTIYMDLCSLLLSFPLNCTLDSSLITRDLNDKTGKQIYLYG